MAAISELKKNLIDLSDEVSGVYQSFGEESQNYREENGEYNHWKEISRIQSLGDCIGKFRSQADVNRVLVQNYKIRVNEL